MVADMSFSGFGRIFSIALLPWLLVAGTAAQSSTSAQSPAFAAAQSPTSAQSPAFVLNSRDATVSQIDRRTMTETNRISVGKEPHHLYPTPDGRSLIVALALSDELLYLDPLTGAVQKRVTGIDDPYQIGFSPDGQWFAVAALRLDRLDLYRHEKGELRLVRRIALAKAPSHLWFSADSRFVFVTLQESDEIAAIDIERQELAWKLPTGRQPAGILITPDDRYLLVGVMGENFVQVIDWRARKTVGRIVTGKGAHNFRGLGDGRHLLVSNRVDNSVSILDMATLSVVGSIPVPGGPDCMEVTADGREAWVTTRWARQVAVIDLAQRRVVRTIGVGRSPHGIYFHERAPLL